VAALAVRANQKDIGTLCVWFSLVMFMTGGVLALLRQRELLQPGLQFCQPELYTSPSPCTGSSWCWAPSCRPSLALPGPPKWTGHMIDDRRGKIHF
jgi:hypothetical protein